MQPPIDEFEESDLKSALGNLVPADEKLGEEMLALNERERKFVIACVLFGCATNHAKGARLAGYSGSPAYLAVQGHRVSHRPKVQAALLAEARKRFQAGTLSAASVALEFVADKSLDPRVRLKASEMVMDRGGLPKATEHRVVSSYEPSREEKLMRLLELAKQLGQDPKLLLGSLVDVVEADFRVLKLEPAADGVLAPVAPEAAA